MRTSAPKRPPTFVDPDRLYALRGFYEASGISPSRAREARLMGYPLPTVDIGKRKWVQGSAGIEWMLKLAEIMPARMAK
jgi:hypothetical protein